MAASKPGLWSALLGLPFVGAGAWLYAGQTQYPDTTGVPFVFFGLFVCLTGLYVQLIGRPESPGMQEGEEIVATRHPTQRVALVKLVGSIPFLVATVYLLYFTQVPYVYPTVSLLVGLFLFSTGLYRYWSNLLTTYYVTTERIIKEYRFFALRRDELPLDKVRGVQERKSVTELMVGLGNVRVASGGGRSLEIVMQNMGRPEQFAAEIRNAMAGR